jgi:hypothetical protein
MGVIGDKINEAFRDFNTQNVPSSGIYRPVKAIIRQLAPLLDYLQSIVEAGVKPIRSVQLATTANVALTGEQTIDGVLTSASEVLVVANTDAKQNGLYLTGAGAWARTADFDTGEELFGARFFVRSGTVNGSKTFGVQNATAPTVGVDNIVIAVVDAENTAIPGAYDAVHGKGADVVSTATINLDASTGTWLTVTGNTGITAFTLTSGRERLIRFTGSPLITVGTSLVGDNDGHDVQIHPNDWVKAVGDASGVVRFWRIRSAPLITDDDNDFFRWDDYFGDALMRLGKDGAFAVAGMRYYGYPDRQSLEFSDIYGNTVSRIGGQKSLISGWLMDAYPREQIEIQDRYGYIDWRPGITLVDIPDATELPQPIDLNLYLGRYLYAVQGEESALVVDNIMTNRMDGALVQASIFPRLAQQIGAVRLRSTSTASFATGWANGDIQDGLTLATNDRIMSDRGSSALTGVYVVQASGAPVRATDADSASELGGAEVKVTSGTSAGKVYELFPAGNITVGTTLLTFVEKPAYPYKARSFVSSTMIKPSDMSGGATLIVRPKSFHGENLSELRLTARVALTANLVGLTPKILTIADSIGTYQCIWYQHGHFARWGITPTWIGTTPTENGTPSGVTHHFNTDAAYSGECRPGIEIADYTNYLTTTLSPVAIGDEAAYLALPTSGTPGKRDYNPMIIEYTGSYPAGDERNGYVIDFDEYFSRFSLAVPDALSMVIGRNDVRRLTVSTVYALFKSELALIIRRWRAHSATKPVCFMLPGTARDPEEDGDWPVEIQAYRALLDLQAELADPNFHICFVQAFVPNDGSFNLTNPTNSPDATTGVITRTIEDGIHPYDYAREENARQLAMVTAYAVTHVV